MEKELKELKGIIKEKLKVCDTKLYPVLCRLKQLENGAVKIEEMIVHFALQEAMPVNSAMAHIECEFKEILNSENLTLEEI
jgi:hypothetical protein